MIQSPKVPRLCLSTKGIKNDGCSVHSTTMTSMTTEKLYQNIYVNIFCILRRQTLLNYLMCTVLVLRVLVPVPDWSSN